MRQLIRKLFFYLSICALFTAATACKEEVEKIVEVEKTYSWQPDANFVFNRKIQLNSYADSTTLMLLGADELAIAKPPIPAKPDSVVFDHYRLNYQVPILDYRLPIGPKFLVFTGADSRLTVIPAMQPVTHILSVPLAVKSLDSSFATFTLNRCTDCMGLNSRGQFLIPYYQSKLDQGYPVVSSEPRFLLLTPSRGLNGPITVKQSVLSVNSNPSVGRLNAVYGFGDNFFVLGSSGTIRVLPDGTAESVFRGQLVNMFSDGKAFYAFGALNADVALFRSTDQGLNWQAVVSPLAYELISIQFRVVDGKVIGFRYGQIWHFDISGNQLSIKELENDGLDGHHITSMAAYRNTVYVSTLSGVYKKSLTKFLAYKAQ